MGPVHPSTHGVLRLILELDGEKVRETRVDTGYLHTGIEKNMEYRTWTQGVTFCTRMDYVAPFFQEVAYCLGVPFFQEVAYCLGVERLLGITDDVPERATLIRVMLMELNRISSHLVAIGTGGNELGATTMFGIGLQGREEILRIFERITGLRMNHAYIRPGGVAQDMPAGTVEYVREKLPLVRKAIGKLEDLTQANPIFHQRFGKVGQGNSLEHIAEIMGRSMESLIHHFKLVTEGFRVPAGQVYQTVEHSKGIMGVHLVSDGGTRPYRAHFRDPSFANLQSLAMMTEGGQLADVVVSLAAIDPVLGGVDR